MAYTDIQLLSWMGRLNLPGATRQNWSSISKRSWKAGFLHYNYLVTKNMTKLEAVGDRSLKLVKSVVKTIAEMIYGATIYEMVRDLNKQRSYIEHLFILIVFGDFLGIPVLPPYYTLRLLPYVVPNLSGWKRTLLRERDLTDLCDQEIT
jgi:hypothetical protein